MGDLNLLVGHKIVLIFLFKLQKFKLKGKSFKS